jgi:hypothetical protein
MNYPKDTSPKANYERLKKDLEDSLEYWNSVRKGKPLPIK